MEPLPQSFALRPGNLRQRLCAWMMSQDSHTFDRWIAPRKHVLLGSLHGDVLEIGPGTGPNLQFYPAGVRWLGVEPNPFMYPYLVETIRRLGLPAGQFRIEQGDAAGVRLPAGEASLDAVVSTLVLCSVPNPAASLKEILRVLKPGGKFVFIEHVAASRGSGLRAFQNLVQPLWTLAGDGCHPNRETWDMIHQAGFASVEIEHFRYPGGGLVAPAICGTASKSLL
jgi:SAM-dependent methyltransferase